MYKKNITYETFDGDTVTEAFYFNLTKTELLQLEAKTPGGLGASLQRISEERDFNKIVKEFQRIVLASYGIRSDDGKRFIKNDEVREEFTQTAAWDALFFELATEAGAAVAFVTGVFPADMKELIASLPVQQELPGIPNLPPPAPKTFLDSDGIEKPIPQRGD